MNAVDRAIARMPSRAPRCVAAPIKAEARAFIRDDWRFDALLYPLTLGPVPTTTLARLVRVRFIFGNQRQAALTGGDWVGRFDFSIAIRLRAAELALRWLRRYRPELEVAA